MFLDAGGFDEAFHFDYEDLDLAFRLHNRGLVLRYAPGALGRHLHAYDWASLIRRYHSRGQAERLMAEKHSWFEPFFAARLNSAQDHAPVSAVWARLGAVVPEVPASLRRRVQALANRWYHQQLAAPFFGAWNGQDDLADLRDYLGPDFDADHLQHHSELMDKEERAAPDERTFYLTSRAYLYDLTMFAVWGTKEPYLGALRRLVPPPARLLDYGCGIGTDGLRLLTYGYQVDFADFENPSTAYLRWRLARRGLDAPVHHVDAGVPCGFDLAYSFDVIEHVDDPFGFLNELENRADLVMVNFLDPDPEDTHLHRPLPVRKLLNHVTRRGLIFYHRYEGRSHLVVYRTGSLRGSRSAAQSCERRVRGELHVIAERLTNLPVASRSKWR
jgi:hypothetical protein